LKNGKKEGKGVYNYIDENMLEFGRMMYMKMDYQKIRVFFSIATN
jgi:hypothetical protein